MTARASLWLAVSLLTVPGAVAPVVRAAEYPLRPIRVIVHYASFGPGSSAHLVGEMLRSTARIKIVHVAYKGGPPVLADVRQRLAAEGAEPIGNTPEQFAEQIRRDLARWAKIARNARVRVQ